LINTHGYNFKKPKEALGDYLRVNDVIFLGYDRLRLHERG
jgi:hypothetical protein